MNMKVIEEKENPLLKRKEVIFSLEYDGKATVSKAELQKMVSEEMKTALDSVEISKILSEVGTPRGKAWVKIWKEKKVPNYSEAKKAKLAEGQVEAPKKEKAESPKEEKKE
jgi:small subunit ribosomal protein S24e